MRITPFNNVREAYNNVYDRNKRLLTMSGFSEDEANRRAAKMAVRFAWDEFNIYKTIGERDVEAPQNIKS